MDHSAPDIEERLQQLELILGQRCWFSKLAETEATEAKDEPPQPPEPGPPKMMTTFTDTSEAHSCTRYTVMDQGEQIPRGVDVCGWQTVLAYPDAFIGKANGPLARPFFEEAITCGDWDFFYLYNPAEPTKEPELVVPTEQFEFYLRFINKQLGIHLTLPHGKAKKRFRLRFDNSLPQPRYLKATHGTWQLKGFVDVDIDDTFAKEQSTDTVFPPFAVEDEQAFAAASIAARQLWLITWEKVRCDGLWSKCQLTPEQRFEQRHTDRLKVLHEAQHVLGFGCEKSDVVLICVDVEWLETQPHPVSEVGLAILDARRFDSADVLAKSHDSWWKLIEAHHWRTYEYSGLRNYRYVAGCPDKFDFGTSTLPPLSMLAADIDKTVKPYKNRNIIIVGHDLKSDLRCLEALGTQFIKSTIAQIDSQVLHQAWQKTDMQSSLDAVLNNLDYSYRFLHNAGNDAVYTLRAMVGVALKAYKGAEKEQHMSSGIQFVKR